MSEHDIIYFSTTNNTYHSLLVKNPLVCSLRLNWLQSSQKNLLLILQKSSLQGLLRSYPAVRVVLQHITQQLNLTVSQSFLWSYLDSTLTVQHQHFVLILPWEQSLAIYQLVVDSSETEHITGQTQTNIMQVSNFKNFGSNIAWSSAPDKDVRFLVDISGESKVDYFDSLAICRNNNILRFNVPMNNSLFVKLSQSTEQPLHDASALLH